MGICTLQNILIASRRHLKKHQEFRLFSSVIWIALLLKIPSQLRREKTQQNPKEIGWNGADLHVIKIFLK